MANRRAGAQRAFSRINHRGAAGGNITGISVDAGFDIFGASVFGCSAKSFRRWPIHGLSHDRVSARRFVGETT